MISRNRFKKGFTLIELLVVISIIGMLVAVAAVSFTSTQRRSRDSRRVQDLEAIQKALEQYAALGTGIYPGNATTPATSPNPALPNFTLPKDPQTSVVYNMRIGTTAYCVCAKLESVSLGNASADVTTTTCNTTAPTSDTASWYCVSQQQ